MCILQYMYIICVNFKSEARYIFHKITAKFGGDAWEIGETQGKILRSAHFKSSRVAINSTLPASSPNVSVIN